MCLHHLSGTYYCPCREYRSDERFLSAGIVRLRRLIKYRPCRSLSKCCPAIEKSFWCHPANESQFVDRNNPALAVAADYRDAPASVAAAEQSQHIELRQIASYNCCTRRSFRRSFDPSAGAPDFHNYTLKTPYGNCDRRGLRPLSAPRKRLRWEHLVPCLIESHEGSLPLLHALIHSIVINPPLCWRIQRFRQAH